MDLQSDALPPELSDHICHIYIHTCIHTYIGRRVSLVGGQLSVPSRCTALHTWLLTASDTSGHGDPALLSCVNPVLETLAVLELSGVGKPALC